MKGLPGKKQRRSFYLFTPAAQLTILLIQFRQLSTLDYGTPPPEPSAEAIKKALIKHEIFQDLGIKKYPEHILQVNYEAYHLMLGTKIPDYQIIVPPDDVKYTHWKYGTYYTLLFVGLDNPSREKPEKRSYQHWAVGNILENQFLNAECLVLYEWSDAPYVKGFHRGVFLLYKQPDDDVMIFDERYILRSQIQVPRSNFNTTLFTAKYRLGDPVAVNFFTTDIEEDHMKEH